MRNGKNPNLFGLFMVALVTSAIIDHYQGASEVRIDRYAIYGLFVLACVLLLRLLRWALGLIKARKYITHSHIDTMHGLEFEKYIALLIKGQGYTNITLTEKYDLGIDIIATKNSETWGIQVKRRASPVKADAVRQVVTAMNHYKCTKAMVITNSYLTKTAIRLANTNDCTVINGATLAEWIKEAQH